MFLLVARQRTSTPVAQATLLIGLRAPCSYTLVNITPGSNLFHPVQIESTSWGSEYQTSQHQICSIDPAFTDAMWLDQCHFSIFQHDTLIDVREVVQQ
jgi:hypothetical protein